MNAKIAIVDYKLGNLYSVKLACEHVGLTAEITSEKKTLLAADAVILPGVGAFGDAMDTLKRLDLIPVLHDIVASGKPLFGICLGLQLLMEGSEEFGAHNGLGLIKGAVRKLDAPKENGHVLKVPQVGWNKVNPATNWTGTLMQGVQPGERFYFVHTYVVEPEDPAVVCSTTTYGHIEFCSSVRYKNIFACQYHPERSGERGLKVYQNLADKLTD